MSHTSVTCALARERLDAVSVNCEDEAVVSSEAAPSVRAGKALWRPVASSRLPVVSRRYEMLSIWLMPILARFQKRAGVLDCQLRAVAVTPLGGVFYIQVLWM